MEFYNATSKRGICQEIDRLCDTDDTAYTRLDKTARVNDALETLVGKIINADGMWQWDDPNQTTSPVGTGTLIEAQESYSFASKYLEIEWVKILNTNGKYQLIYPIDQKELDVSTEQAFSTTGFPMNYEKTEDTIRLYPAPTASSCTLTNGLKIKFKRTAVPFTAVSTTAADSTVPGIPSPYHILLSYMAALPYCMSYKKDRVALYQNKIVELTNDMLAYFGRREKDSRKKMTMAQIAFR